MSLQQFNQLKPGDKVLIEATVRGPTKHGRAGNTVVIVQREYDELGRPQEPIFVGIHHDFLLKDDFVV